MKKTSLVSMVTGIGIIAVMAVVQSGGNNRDAILNANVEALAWNSGEGGGGADVVKCKPNGPTCYHDIVLCDEKGNPLKDAEGNPIKYTERLDGYKNVPSEAQ